jgi:hypothetical protein
LHGKRYLIIDKIQKIKKIKKIMGMIMMKVILKMKIFQKNLEKNEILERKLSEK